VGFRQAYMCYRSIRKGNLLKIINLSKTNKKSCFMKTTLCLILLSLSFTTLYGQNYKEFDDYIHQEKAAITIGILQGGGGLVGADFEVLLTNQLGIQFGAGIFSFGGGITYHFEPSIRSSFISFQYWHQGIGEGFAQSAVGPSFVFRGKRWFTFQIGIGKTLEEGPAYPKNMEQTPVMLLYSMGIYFPF
jgi:hypothetical protein